MLGIKGKPGANLNRGQSVGAHLDVEWTDIRSPDPDLEHGAPTCFAQARTRGGAAFNRLEGIYRSHDGRSIYFVSTSGGDALTASGTGYGQLWQYSPAHTQNR